ncbi:Transposon TX1 [Planoprotostelium fungivorum]|uniref:Transposon TX1 n=1 Tax=Planoprotostelium fungivorum TaxID=1890364 RepID=A0A2P6NNW4_9EUKA|nr:Transposon TX1 [Planoprotostelium fungivorum]
MSNEVSYTNELQPSESPYPSHSLNLHPDPIYGGNEDSFENLIQTSQEEDSSSLRGWFAEHQIEGTKPSVEDERSRRSPNHRNQESYQEVAYFQETQKPTNDRDDSHTISPQPNHFVEVSINNRQILHKQLQEEDAAKDTNGISHMEEPRDTTRSYRYNKYLQDEEMSGRDEETSGRDEELTKMTKKYRQVEVSRSYRDSRNTRGRDNREGESADDVVVVTETGLSKVNLKPREIVSRCDEFNLDFHPADNVDGKAGHVAIVIRRDLRTTNILSYKSGRVMSIDIPTRGQDIRIVGVYKGFEKLNNNELMNIIKDIAREKKNKNMIVTGDFNEITSASDYRATYIQKKKKGPLHKLLQQRGLIDSAGLLNAREKHTYVQTNKKGKAYSRLDYAYVSNDLSKQTLFYNIDYSAMTSSDHFPIWITMNKDPIQDEDITPTKKRPNFRAVSKEQWSRWSLQMDACQFAERSPDECTNNWTKSITTTPPKEDKQGTLSIYKVNIDRIRKEIKRRQKEIVRDTHNTAWKIHENKLKKDPGYVFKLLKTVGKKSTRNNDKPHIIEEANGTKSSDPEKS